jgi:membrane protein implicated in regulation of membrane protease activity
VAVLSLLLFRGRLVEAMRTKPVPTQTDEMVGEIGVAYEEIPAGGVGKVELRGTVWNSRNEDEAPLAQGARCKVVRVEGLSLGVRRE